MPCCILVELDHRLMRCGRRECKSSGVPKMSEFKLPNAITLFSQEKTTITSLWTVYVVATFAAAGYGISDANLNCLTASAVTFGFSTFSFGHWQLLRQSLEINIIIEKDVRNAIDRDQDNPFKSSIKVLIANANPIWVSRTFHLFVDLSVILSIWSRVSGCAAKIFGIFGI
jgi:hypothetical protein